VIRPMLVTALLVACSPGAEAPERDPLEERAETDRIFARTAMELLAAPAVAEIGFYEREGRFSTDAEEIGLESGALEPGPTAGGGNVVGVQICAGDRVVVLDETTPHAATFAVKLVGTAGSVAVGHHAGEVPTCDTSPGPPAWSNGCRVDREGLECPEASP
jgi:hypothetical protein